MKTAFGDLEISNLQEWNAWYIPICCFQGRDDGGGYGDRRRVGDCLEMQTTGGRGQREETMR